MPRVFVVQRTMRRDRQTGALVPVHDVGEAGAYGDLVDLLGPSAKPFTPEPVVAELWSKLCDYGEDDWLLCIGNPVLIGWAVALAAQAGGGQVNMLQWSNGGYEPIRALLWPGDEYDTHSTLWSPEKEQ